MMKKALILGVSGQDGAYLARLLLQKGYEVYGSSRDAQMSSFSNLHALGIYDDVCVESIALNDFRNVIQTLMKIEPTEVYNLAGQTSVNLSFKQPVEAFESIGVGTLNLLEAIRLMQTPIKFYNACSSECFGNTGDSAADESWPFKPRSPYAVAKCASYWEVANYREAYGLFACSGIFFNHESPLRPERFVTKKIVSAATRIARGSDEKLHLGNISIRRDWGWAPEYIEAIYLMLQQETPNDYVIATGESNSLEDFVAAAFDYVGLDWHNYVEIDQKLIRPLDIAAGRGNPSKARVELGWQAKHKMRDVVRMMMEHEEKQKE
ncbi:MAG: GDP-mannose 4,6-dehydratase [Planctomycetota bacterium]|nr:MAG: GDP-mannose 4,6-dehydratase [Planctomycetota bacterium]